MGHEAIEQTEQAPSNHLRRRPADQVHHHDDDQDRQNLGEKGKVDHFRQWGRVGLDRPGERGNERLADPGEHPQQEIEDDIGDHNRDKGQDPCDQIALKMLQHPKIPLYRPVPLPLWRVAFNLSRGISGRTG